MWEPKMSAVHLLESTLALHASETHRAVHLSAPLLANAPKKLYVARTSSVHDGSLTLLLSKAKIYIPGNTAV